MSFPQHSQGGFIQLVIIIIILILIVSYFGLNLRALFDNPQTQDNFSAVWEWVQHIWNNYLERPARWIWEHIISFIWNDLFLGNLDRLRGGESFNDIAPESPTVSTN
ncbi:hypothetical protein L0Y40_01260 [Candidatus Wolfebacteria bacterium]|nr:hypothetical protein [Candidatus Wolfebacteria bacterium]